jgi:O-antigen ligase
MAVKLKNDGKDMAIFMGAILAIVSLFVSRAALSIFTGVLVMLTFWRQPPSVLLRNFLRQPFLWIISLLFWVALLSGIWSANQESWQRVMLVKLPLLLLPVAFASSFRFTRRQWQVLAAIFVGLVLLGALWSIGQYLPDPAQVTAGYSRAKTVVTPLGNDRIRFSWLTAFAAILSILCASKFYRAYRWAGIAFTIAGILLVVYLHLLAVRTGLLGFYLVCFVAGITWLLEKKKIGLLAISFACIMPVLAYLILPGFKNRVDYLRYEMDFALKGSYIPGSTDPVRIISLKAGTYLMFRTPLMGVGFGDVQDESDRWYLRQFPQMSANDHILPSSEYILYGAAAGIPGLLIFLFCMLFPFFVRVRDPFSWCLLNLGIAAGFLFDIGLEVQYGIFIYLASLLLTWKWQVDENI